MVDPGVCRTARAAVAASLILTVAVGFWPAAGPPPEPRDNIPALIVTVP
jgi:hypothetical protein